MQFYTEKQQDMILSLTWRELREPLLPAIVSRIFISLNVTRELLDQAYHGMIFRVLLERWTSNIIQNPLNSRQCFNTKRRTVAPHRKQRWMYYITTVLQADSISSSLCVTRTLNGCFYSYSTEGRRNRFRLRSEQRRREDAGSKWTCDTD